MKKTASFLLDELHKLGSDRVQCGITHSQKQELNVENNQMTLMRTTYDTTASITAIKDNKRGSISVTLMENEALRDACELAVELASAAPEDSAYDLAQVEDGPVSFSSGAESGDSKLILFRVEEMLESIKKEYPFITITDGAVVFTADETYMENSNGVQLQSRSGRYNYSFTFSARNGIALSSMNGASCVSYNLSKPLLETGGFAQLLEQNIRELDAAPLGDKFSGSLLMTPHCVPDFLSSYIGTFLSDGALISGTSLFADKLGSQVAGENIGIYSDPTDSSLCGYPITHDGYRVRPQDYVKNGKLVSYALSLYGSRKTGGIRAGNYGGMPALSGGDTALDALIGKVERGILLGRLSGGNPSENGDFTGVAKNSFYIENGRITRPVSETMIAGNLSEMFKHVRGISNETIDFGFGKYPWVLSDDFIISG